MKLQQHIQATMAVLKKYMIGVWLLIATATNLFAQQGTVAAGGVTTGTGGTVSFSIGTVSYINATGSSGNISQGLQQPVVSNGKTIPGRIEAEAWDTKSGYQYAIATTDAGGGLKMVGISNGSWLDYNVNVLTTGNYTVGFRVATTQGNTQFQIKSGNTVLATVNIANTGGWDNWNTVTITNVPLTAGNQTLRIQSTNNDNCDFNWMEYSLPVPFASSAKASSTVVVDYADETTRKKELVTTEKLKVVVFPNPASSYFNLKVNGGNNEELIINVYDMAGRPVQQLKGSAEQMFRLGDHFINGIYIVEVRQGLEKVVTRVVKQ